MRQLRGKAPAPGIPSGTGSSQTPARAAHSGAIPGSAGAPEETVATVGPMHSLFGSGLGATAPPQHLGLCRGTSPGCPGGGEMLSHGCTQHLPLRGSEYEKNRAERENRGLQSRCPH